MNMNPPDDVWVEYALPWVEGRCIPEKRMKLDGNKWVWEYRYPKPDTDKDDEEQENEQQGDKIKGKHMKKKKLKKRIRELEDALRDLKAYVKANQCPHCENYKPETVKWQRWKPLEDALAGIKRQTEE